MLKMFFVVIMAVLIGDAIPKEKVRIMNFDGQEYRTTFSIDARFIGKFKGQKNGYLLLNEDGSGEYNYDIFGVSPKTCKPGIITFDWGFLLDENNQIIRHEREYGFSYPILYKSTGDISFQGCSKSVFIDYILEYKNGELHVSSSDDWVKID